MVSKNVRYTFGFGSLSLVTSVQNITKLFLSLRQHFSADRKSINPSSIMYIVPCSSLSFVNSSLFSVLDTRNFTSFYSIECIFIQNTFCNMGEYYVPITPQLYMLQLWSFDAIWDLIKLSFLIRIVHSRISITFWFPIITHIFNNAAKSNIHRETNSDDNHNTHKSKQMKLSIKSMKFNYFRMSFAFFSLLKFPNSNCLLGVY